MSPPIVRGRPITSLSSFPVAPSLIPVSLLESRDAHTADGSDVFVVVVVVVVVVLLSLVHVLRSEDDPGDS